MTDTPLIIVVLGATASGKSQTALELARQLNAEILSADSMQVYRSMDIGTAKPTPQEQAEIPHHLIDLMEPDQEFTVARFVELADEILKFQISNFKSEISNLKSPTGNVPHPNSPPECQGRGQRPIIITGGTPLYYKALFDGLFEGPGANEQLRQQLRTQPLEALHRQLMHADPSAAQRIHPNDAKRLIRALEVFELTGKPISQLQREWAGGQRRHQARWIGLHWEKDQLNRRINARVKDMIVAGWVDEVRQILERYKSLSKTAGEATGYRQLIQHARGELSMDDATEQIKIATRQLARRQLKWFRRFPDVHWIEGNLPLEDRVNRIRELL